MKNKGNERLKAEFVEAMGYWSDGWQSLCERDPGYFAAALELARVPAQEDILDPKTRALIRLAINVAVTHLNQEGVRHSIELAMAEGATEAEVLEVCELTSVLGIQSCVVALPLLEQELASVGRAEEMGPSDVDARRSKLKDAFISKRGYWSPLWEQMLRSSPGFFEAYLNFSAYPWENGTIPPKTKELIYVAIDASTNHLYEPGIQIHIRNALAHGATAAEVIAVLQITSLISLESSAMGAATLTEI